MNWYTSDTNASYLMHPFIKFLGFSNPNLPKSLSFNNHSLSELPKPAMGKRRNKRRRQEDPSENGKWKIGRPEMTKNLLEGFLVG